MNLSVLEVTWDKGVAKSQWWGYWNLTHNHLLAPSHPRPTKRCEWWAEARGALQDHVQAGGVGKQEANSEQLEGIPGKQTMERFQPSSRGFTKPLKEGAGAASSQQGWSVSHSPVTWERAPSHTAHQPFRASSSLAISASRPRAQQWNIRLSSCKPLLLVFHIFGCTPGKVLAHFTP